MTKLDDIKAFLVYYYNSLDLPNVDEIRAEAKRDKANAISRQYTKLKKLRKVIDADKEEIEKLANLLRKNHNEVLALRKQNKALTAESYKLKRAEAFRKGNAIKQRYE